MTASVPTLVLDRPAAAPVSRWGPWLFVLVAALLPAVPWLLDLPRFGALQYNDYYGNLAQVIDRDTFTWNPLRWLAIKSNEHTVTIPTLLYAFNHGLTGGDNRGLSLLSILLAVASAAAIAVAAARAFRWSTLGGVTVAFLASALLMTPVSVHSYVMGFSGAIWITANALAVLAIVLLARVTRNDHAARLLPVVLVAMLGAITYTTNLSLWPALLVAGGLLALRCRQLGVLVVTAAVVFLAQWLLRTRPANHPTPKKELGPILEYLGIYLGWPFVTDHGAAAALGLAAAIAFVALLVVAIRARRCDGAQPAAAAFAALAIYGLGNGLGTAIGRAGFGLGQATSSRYGSLAVLFWIGLLGLGTWAGRRVVPTLTAGAWPRAVRWLPAAAAVVLAVATWQRGAPLRQYYFDQAAWSPVAAIALRHGIDDTEVLQRINNAPEQFAAVPWLERMQHVPFATPRPVRHHVQVDATRLRPQPDPQVLGALDQLQPVRRDVVRVQGWAFVRPGLAPIVEALLLDDQGIVRGELALGSPRDDVMRKVDATQRYCGIRGYAFLGPEVGPLRIWVRRLGLPYYTPLHGREAVGALAAR